ncbi:Gfo/Idh/MocA family protein [Streptomyces sp. NPDC020800]|uniref:Gfo/Idh/MocA family protein n=1 Tax=Streptomyces sp. NPDC020800 TaxID=3365092 RepID=UPI0037A0340D
MTAIPVRVGIIGCGMVAEEYATTLAASPLVRLTTCADADPARATAFGGRHGIPATEPGSVLDPDLIDLAVILTPPHTHRALVLQAIAARVPAVWSEKPLALTPGDAAQLVSEADSAGILLGAAPDTTLGPAFLTAHDAVRAGRIGTVLSATATLMSTGPERWHPSPEPFYAQGAGPLGDMGPYYLAALDELLGPLQVHSATANTRKVRTIRSGPAAGKHFTAQAPTHIAAFLTAADGVPVNLTASFDAAATRTPRIELQGIRGALVLPDPNFHIGDVLFAEYGTFTWNPLTSTGRAPQTTGRGMGVIDLATALTQGTSPACTGARAARIAAVSDAILRAAARPHHALRTPPHQPGTAESPATITKEPTR